MRASNYEGWFEKQGFTIMVIAGTGLLQDQSQREL